MRFGTLAAAVDLLIDMKKLTMMTTTNMATNVPVELEVDMIAPENDYVFEYEEKWDNEDNIPMFDLLQPSANRHKSANRQKTVMPKYLRPEYQ